MRKKREVTFRAPKEQTDNVYTPENMGTKSPNLKHWGVERLGRCTIGTRAVWVPQGAAQSGVQYGSAGDDQLQVQVELLQVAAPLATSLQVQVGALLSLA